MSNPSAHDPDRLVIDPEVMPDPVRGILSWLTADTWSAGEKHLPPPGPEQVGQPWREVVLRGVPRFGIVRMTFELASHRHRRTRLWSWRAVRAESMLLRVPVREARWYGPETRPRRLAP